MPIYNLFEKAEKRGKQAEATISPIDFMQSEARHKEEEEIEAPDTRNPFFSAIAARLFFFLLLCVDLFWGAWSLFLFFFSLLGNILLGFKVPACKRFFLRRYLSCKRAAICAISLLVAIFSPALGTMFACSYFLMYDKKGVKEIVPVVLHDQFREFFTF